MIKNIIHLGSPVVLGVFFYFKSITDTLAGGIGLGTFLVLILLSLIYNYNQKYNPKSETEYFIEALDRYYPTGNSTTKKSFPYKYDSERCLMIMFIYLIGWIIYCVVTFKSTSDNLNDENIKTEIDSSYQNTVSSDAPIGYQENYSDTLDSYQSDTIEYENNSNIQTNYDYESDYFVGEWIDENSIIYFKADGTCTLKLKSDEEGYYTKSYFWKYENQILYMGSNVNNLLLHTIYDKNLNYFSYKAEGENIIYHAERYNSQ